MERVCNNQNLRFMGKVLLSEGFCSHVSLSCFFFQSLVLHLQYLILMYDLKTCPENS